MKRSLRLLALAIFAIGCAKDINNNEAVKQGVVEYLSKRMSQTGLDMNLMDVEVSSVKFDKNEAHAVVAFKPKGSATTGGMTMNYALERQGAKWVVKGRQDSGLNPHGTPAVPDGALPPNHPPVESAQPDPKK